MSGALRPLDDLDSGVTGAFSHAAIVKEVEPRATRELVPGKVRVGYAARRLERVGALCAAGRDAVRLDLDDPRTFAHALHGVDWVYLLTGYTVAMLTQSKTLVDAAVKAGVSHLVHQGVSPTGTALTRTSSGTT